MPRIMPALIGAVVALALATPAHAQLTSPIPAGTIYLFSVVGVMNQGGLGTYFSCTSTSPDAQNVTVEAFDGDAVASGSATLVVAAGKGVRFGTQNAASLVVDSILGSGAINGGGTARILSTSKKLLCHAFVATTAGGIPTFTPLTIVAKLKQKAAN
jgi:hypothetical protein